MCVCFPIVNSSSQMTSDCIEVDINLASTKRLSKVSGTMLGRIGIKSIQTHMQIDTTFFPENVSIVTDGLSAGLVGLLGRSLGKPRDEDQG